MRQIFLRLLQVYVETGKYCFQSSITARVIISRWVRLAATAVILPEYLVLYYRGNYHFVRARLPDCTVVVEQRAPGPGEQYHVQGERQ